MLVPLTDPGLDPALFTRHGRRFALVGLIGFIVYVAAVVGGATVQSALFPGLAMGWFQQVGGIMAVGLVALFLADRSVILGWRLPNPGWLVPAIVTGLSITLLGTVAGLAAGETPVRHGAEYFLYEATMPGLSEELGFRGLLLGTLLAAFTDREHRTGFRVWMIVLASALPFAALHLLELTGAAAAIIFGFTFAAGVLLGRLRLATASILPCIVAHNVANVASGVVDHLLLAMH